MQITMNENVKMNSISIKRWMLLIWSGNSNTEIIRLTL